MADGRDMFSGTCTVCGGHLEAPTSEPAVETAQTAVLEHIQVTHSTLFEQLSVVNLGYLVESGARTFAIQ